MSNKLVSIVIPVFNGEKYIETAINSALAQSYKNIEIIVVNDGSSDNTRNICLTYNDRIRYFEKDNGGVSSALNLGIQNMNGEYFSWLSHDDLYYPDKIEKQISYINTKNDNVDKVIVYSLEDKINSKGEIIYSAFDNKSSKIPLPFELLYNRFIGGCSLLIPAIAFQKVGLFREDLKAIQDYEMWFRMMSNGYILEYLPIVSGASRIHSAQTSIAQKKMCYDEDVKIYKEIIDSLPIELLSGSIISKNILYYKLAYLYKKRQRIELYKYCVLKGNSYLKINDCHKIIPKLYKIKANIYISNLDVFLIIKRIIYHFKRGNIN